MIVILNSTRHQIFHVIKDGTFAFVRQMAILYCPKSRESHRFCRPGEQRRCLHPLLLWGTAGKAVVRYAAWIAGRITVDYVAREQRAMQKRGTSANYSKVLYSILFNKTSAAVAFAIIGLIGAIFVIHVEYVPLTMRRRLMLLGDNTLNSLCIEASIEIRTKAQGRILRLSDPRHQRVAQACQRLIGGARSMQEIAGAENALMLHWNVTVIDDDVINAFVLPNGDVYVYTGLLVSIDRHKGSDDVLAAILGHEMAHALLRHSAEQLSLRPFSYAMNFSLLTLAWSTLPIGIEFIPGFSHLLSGATESAVAALTELPNSRTCELEADHIGLLIAAAACYDPRKAANFWVHCCHEELQGEDMGSRLLSTHPPSKERSDKLHEILPDAERIRAASALCPPTATRPFFAALWRTVAAACRKSSGPPDGS